MYVAVNSELLSWDKEAPGLQIWSKNREGVRFACYIQKKEG